MRLITALLLAVACASCASADNDVIGKLQAISYTIKTNTGSGSGVAFTRRVGEDTETYILTAGHVVDGLRKTREVIVKGSPKTVVEFDDAQVVQEFYDEGRRIGETQFDARVIKYSGSEHGD